MKLSPRLTPFLACPCYFGAQWLRLWFIALLLAGCDRGVDFDDHTILPSIRTVQAAKNPFNSLSVLVTVVGKCGSSARVEIQGDSVAEKFTAWVPMTQDSAIVPVLGLRPRNTYSLRTIVVSLTGSLAVGPTLTVTTDSLPADIPRFALRESNAPSVQYVLLGITPALNGRSYAVIVDRTGQIVWYRAFDGQVSDFQKQPNGRYTICSLLSGGPQQFYEVDASGTVTDSYRPSNNLETGPHELRMKNGDMALFGIEFRTMDLTSIGGLVAASVRGLVVELRHMGQPTLLWNTFDHFSVTDATSDIPLSGVSVNPWHGNAIDVDTDGNLLVSFRHMDEVTKIDATTGAIIWRMGGKHNQFTFLNDPLNGFSHQHGIRRLSNGNIIMFDNGDLHPVLASRAVEYRLDETAKTAQMVWEYRPDPALYGLALGFAQRLGNGNTLVCFGTAQRIIEVDASGTKRWDLEMTEAGRNPYRAMAVESLY